MKRKKKYPKLTPEEKRLATRFIPEEIATGQYPQKQAVAIGINRAKAAAKERSPRTRIESIMEKYL
jgi:hypothetical protein